MNSKIQKSILAGIIGTAIMTIVMMVAPLMGLPKMNAAEMLSMMLGVPAFAGWLMHFMIGIVFAFSYSIIFAKVLSKASNTILKGAIFGFIAFVFAQIMMLLMGLILPMPQSNANMGLMLLGSMIGHVVFGIMVAVVAVDKKSLN